MRHLAVVLLIFFMTCTSYGQEIGHYVLSKKKPIESQIIRESTIYDVLEDFDLEGNTIRLPKGSQLCFDGGSIKNGTIISDYFLINDWKFTDVIIKGNFDFITPINVPQKGPKGFISTILSYKPIESTQPTVFVFASNLVYDWEGVLYINKKNVTLTGGGTIEGHIHLGMDSDTFLSLTYDKYPATSHFNFTISNLRFSKYNKIGSSSDAKRITNYITNATVDDLDNISISLVNVCHVKISDCFFDNVPFPIVYQPNQNYVNQNVRRLNIINCDFERCHTAVYAPSITNHPLEYGDLLFSNNNVYPTYAALDVSCIDGFKVLNNTFNTCERGQKGLNIRAFHPGQVVITNNSFYGEENRLSIELDSPGTAIIDGNLFSAQGTSLYPDSINSIACVRIIRTDKTSYTSGLAITNNLFTDVKRLPIFVDGYIRGARITGNTVSGRQYAINRSVLYYFNSTSFNELELQSMRMSDNILEDYSGTLSLRMDVIKDYYNSNMLFPESVWVRNHNNRYSMFYRGNYFPVSVKNCTKSKPIYVISPLEPTDYSKTLQFVFNGIHFFINTKGLSKKELLDSIVAQLKPIFGNSHSFEIIDGLLWIVGIDKNVPVYTPMYEYCYTTKPSCFRVAYQNLGYSIKIKDADGKNIVDNPIGECGIDINDDGKNCFMNSNSSVLLCRDEGKKYGRITFKDRPYLGASYKWIFNDIFIACGQGGHLTTNALIKRIIQLCYSNEVSVVGNSLVFKEPNTEYNINSYGSSWSASYEDHVVSFSFMTANKVEYFPETGEYNNSGDSNNRPLKPYVGFQYFDTSIGKPLFWNGSNWVDALGKEY